MKNTKTGILSCLSLTAAMMLSGCADLSNIKSFAAISADTASYTSFVTDYEKSAERQRRYETPEKKNQLDNTIAERKAQQKPLLDMLRGVQNYMNALGALASDQVISYDQSLSSVTDALKSTKAVTDKQADAFGALSKLLSKAATDAYRQAKLRTVIKDANPNFQVVIQTAKDIVTKDFVASLDIEAVSVDHYFRGVVETAAHAPPQDASIELVKEISQQRLDEIELKRQACLVYAATLDTVAKGHQALNDNADKLSSSELLSTIQSYGTSISQLLTQLKQLK